MNKTENFLSKNWRLILKDSKIWKESGRFQNIRKGSIRFGKIDCKRFLEAFHWEEKSLQKALNYNLKEYTFVQGHFEAEFTKAKNQVGMVFGIKTSNKYNNVHAMN